MMRIPLFKVYMDPQVSETLSKVVRSGYVGQGRIVEQFEERLRAFLNVPFLLTVNSGTSALQLALHLAKQGKEVLTTPLTCFATTAAILHAGLKPKWVDVDPESYNLSLEDLENKLSRHTSLIMVVHFAGWPVDLDRLSAILDRCEYKYGHRPLVIEDCAHAFGGGYAKGRIGSSGNFCCFSFQAIKNLTTGDGGLLVVPEEYYARAKRLRWFGLDRGGNRLTQNIQEAGFKYHMNDIAAAIGLNNLNGIDFRISRQIHNRETYYGEFPELAPKYTEHNTTHGSGWVCPLRVERRTDFERWLAENGIEASPVHARNDHHDCVRSFRTFLPGMDLLEQKMTCVPSGWWLSQEDLNYVVDVIKKGW